MKIQNGAGNGYMAKVNARNQLYTFSETETESAAATELGNAYNINTGLISLTGSGDSAILYVKNEEVSDMYIENIAFGIDSAATVSTTPVITIIRNPTAGDITTDASAVAMNQNRNFGSSKTLSTSTLAYKGKQGGTMTGGNDIIIFMQGTGGRLFANIGLQLPKGNSIGVKIDSNISSDTMLVYCALVLYIKDPAVSLS